MDSKSKLGFYVADIPCQMTDIKSFIEHLKLEVHF